MLEGSDHYGEIFTISPDEAIDDRTLSIHSINPLANNNSTSRSQMMTSHFSQMVTLLDGQEKIVQSGLDHQFGENTFSIKIEEDCYFLGLVERYKSIDKSEPPVELTIFVSTLSGKFDYYTIPFYFTLHQYYGFEYKYDREKILNMPEGTLLKAGTVLADSPSVKKNSGFGFGVNANMALITVPGVAEDGVLISESMAKKLAYPIFETRTIDFGSTKFLLNTYGDDEVYKGFPNIGEKINEESILAVLRNNDDEMTAALTSKNDLKHYNQEFDKCIYVNGPGDEVELNGKKYDSGVVVDIKAWHNPKAKQKNNIFPGTLGTTGEYVDKLKNYYKDILDFYFENIKKKARQSNRRPDGSLNMSDRLNRLISEALVIADHYDKKLPLTHRSTPLDLYKVEFTIKYICNVTIGHKISDLNGGKGVIVDVLPDDQMPYTSDGVRADIIMDPTSIVSRMNLGRIFEIYFNSASRKARRMVLEELDKNPGDKEAKIRAWKIVLDFIKHFETEQFEGYLQATEEEVDEILDEIRREELYIIYRISSKKPAYAVVLDLEKSPFKPTREPIHIPNGDKILITKSPIMIGPLTTILLSKTADTWSCAASSKVNHYGFPITIGANSKYNYPYKPNPTRLLSETDVRHYLANGGETGSICLAEIKDRANSRETHELMYYNILNSPHPGYEKTLVDRKQHPFGTDVALGVLEAIMSVAGVEICYVEDKASNLNKYCSERDGLKGGHNV